MLAGVRGPRNPRCLVASRRDERVKLVLQLLDLSKKRSNESRSVARITCIYPGACYRTKVAHGGSNTVRILVRGDRRPCLCAEVAGRACGDGKACRDEKFLELRHVSPAGTDSEI